MKPDVYASDIVSEFVSAHPLSRRELLGRALALGLSAPALAALLAACGRENQPAGTSSSDKTFIVGSGSPEITIDPGTNFDGQSVLFWRAPYENLLVYKRDNPLSLELAPHLAESFESSEDGLTHTLKLRKDVKFSDGTPFNAEAARLNLERVSALKVGMSFVFASIASMDVTDDSTLVIKLKRFEDGFLSSLAGKWAPFMISPKAIKEQATGNDWGQAWLQEHSAGTGPYQLESYSKNQEGTFTRNASYWKGWDGNHFDRIVIKDVSDPSSLRLLIEQGQVHAATFLPDDVLFALEGKSGIKMLDEPTFDIYMLALNCKKGPTADKTVRQAISYGFDYDSWIKNSMQGKATRAHGLIPKGIPGYSDDTPLYSYDPAKAKALLAQAGHPNGGFTIQYIFETGYWWKRPLAELFQSNMRDLGIEVTITEVSPSALFDLLSNPDRAEHAFGFVLHPLMARAYDDLQLEFTTAAQGAGGLNWVYYSNPEFDQTLEQAVHEPDGDKRSALYRRANEILVDDAPALWIMSRNYNAPIRDKVEGYTYSAMYLDTFDFHALRM